VILAESKLATSETAVVQSVAVTSSESSSSTEREVSLSLIVSFALFSSSTTEVVTTNLTFSDLATATLNQSKVATQEASCEAETVSNKVSLVDSFFQSLTSVILSFVAVAIAQLLVVVTAVKAVSLSDTSAVSITATKAAVFIDSTDQTIVTTEAEAEAV
jgi:hypothetical protein